MSVIGRSLIAKTDSALKTPIFLGPLITIGLGEVDLIHKRLIRFGVFCFVLGCSLEERSVM